MSFSAEETTVAMQDGELTRKTPPLLEYEQLLMQLISLRSAGPVPDDMEAEIAEGLNDCRSRMTAAEESQIGAIVERLRER